MSKGKPGQRRIKAYEQYKEQQGRDKVPVAMQFQPKHVKFLEVYAETLDFDEAKRVAGLRKDAIAGNPWLMEEVAAIEELVRYQVNAKAMAKGNHVRLMKKFEEGYDAAAEDEDRRSMVGFSSTLARMSDTMLRASGEFFPDDKDIKGVQLPQVVINIGVQQDEPRKIDANVVDVESEEGGVD